MARNTMQDLQNHLFEVIEGLKNNSDPEASDNEKMDIHTAKAISQAAKVIIDGAKVEVSFLNLLMKSDSPNDISKRTALLGLNVPQKDGEDRS